MLSLLVNGFFFFLDIIKFQSIASTSWWLLSIIMWRPQLSFGIGDVWIIVIKLKPTRPVGLKTQWSGTKTSLSV